MVNLRKQGAKRAVLQILESHPPDVSAIFAASDVMALGAMEAVRSVGREVPRDVAVVGYDDSEAASLARPPSHHRPAGRAADGGEDGCERNLERNE